MYAPIFRVILVLCVCTTVAPCAIAQLAMETPEDLTGVLLAQTQERLVPIMNYRCTQVLWAQPNSPTPERRTLFVNRQGRGRIKALNGRNIRTFICDGVKTIELQEATQSDGTVTHSVSIVPEMPQLMQQYNLPWYYLGGMLADELATARDEQAKIRTSKTSSGQYRIDIRDKTGSLRIIVIDPNQDYVPIERKTYTNGQLQSEETVTFQQITYGQNDAKTWFPLEVHATASSGTTGGDFQKPTLKHRFSDVSINIDNRLFDRVLVARFAKGAEVYDSIRQERYIVGANTITPLADTNVSEAVANKWSTLPESEDAPWGTAFDRVYHLEAEEALRYIQPPFIPERTDYLIAVDPGLADEPGRVFQSQPCLFQWGTASSNTQRLTKDRSVPLSTILEDVIHLGSYAYEGPPHLLNVRLTGDWIVRKDASIGQRLRVLEQAILKETGRSITFVRQPTQAIVARATGTYRFNPLPEASSQEGILVLAGNWDVRQGNTILSTGCDTMTALLDHVGNAIGMAIIDNTDSSDQELCWMMHESSNLRDIKNVKTLYNTQLRALLGNLAHQMNLTFRLEITTIDVWHVASEKAMAVQAR